ncbi:MAG: hypothetical protein QOJ42_1837, partial [Acidobacteriaceae bacterium]|nr:hypothetical protein [Acidobacteriaceae bacterium]
SFGTEVSDGVQTGGQDGVDDGVDRRNVTPIGEI